MAYDKVDVKDVIELVAKRLNSKKYEASISNGRLVIIVRDIKKISCLVLRKKLMKI